MQLAFINNLMKMRSEGIEKALLLSVQELERLMHRHLLFES